MNDILGAVIAITFVLIIFFWGGVFGKYLLREELVERCAEKGEILLSNKVLLECKITRDFRK